MWQLARLHQPPELLDGRVVHEGVSHHQHLPPPARQGDQLCRFLGAGRQGFLDQDVLAGEQGVADQGVVGVDRARHHHRVDVGGEEVLVVAKEADARVPDAHGVEALLLQIGDGDELRLRDLVDVSDQVRAPIPAADDAEPQPSIQVLRPAGLIG